MAAADGRRANARCGPRQLRRLLAERPGWSCPRRPVSALFSRQPAQVKLDTLAALCTALECTPNDLFEVDTTPVARTTKSGRPTRRRNRSRPGSDHAAL